MWFPQVNEARPIKGYFVNRLNRKVEYALMALKVMAKKRQGELTSVKEVVDQT